jgi:carbamoyl-phosphate synthase large subunit
MPKREDLHSIMVVGSGSIIIGQACEFDYSGTQACRALRQEGYKVILVNSNPATIMTDPEVADRTYIEPITPGICEKIIEKEKPDALLPTMGGQTALNIAVSLATDGVLDKHNVELIGADLEVIKKAEDRNLFKNAMHSIGLDLPVSGYARNFEEAVDIVNRIGFPIIIRPSFTLGGSGGAVCRDFNEFESMARRALNMSPIHTTLLEESLIGWKEYELELMRDNKDNVIIVCSIENLDPMGIHTGDSITVAPQQTLTDTEYQVMRDAGIAAIREIGVDTGGSNIQFAVNPETGAMVVIELNPRVSRSSALASKATGFPIAKIAAKLAVGYALDEIQNDITKKTPACFEPALDYCVVKIPRWAFDKFPGTNKILTTQMKSVGETMAFGRTFREALQKGMHSLEAPELESMWYRFVTKEDLPKLREKLTVPDPERIVFIRYAFQCGMGVDEIHELTEIDPWFLHNIKEIVDMESQVRGKKELSREMLHALKKYGFSDYHIGKLIGKSEGDIRSQRKKESILPTMKSVDTCAAEFESYTPYFYSTYETENESVRSKKKRIVILGSGPNRIGQGIEFDYCCVKTVMALREKGYEVIMVNNNPETVSTDYDVSDKLYFEPLTLESVLNVTDIEKPDGVIVQMGGQTPLKLAIPLQERGVPIIGTSPDSIDLAENRKRFSKVVDKLGLKQPENGVATSFAEARSVAHEIGYPILVRPSYVLGGRAMVVVYDDEALEHYMKSAIDVSPEHPVLVDEFLEDAFEYDVDAICDGHITVIGGLMQQIEEAGIHSGDSACSLPPCMSKDEWLDTMREQTRMLAKELKVIGLLNIQFAVKSDTVYVLEVNPRASRTVPFVSKATGVSLVKLAAGVMVGETLEELGFTEEPAPKHISIKAPVFPFVKFSGIDSLLGPEMRSTGEVMGIGEGFGISFAKAQLGTDFSLPTSGTVFVSVHDKDKKLVLPIVRKLKEMGFDILATKGTAEFLENEGTEAQRVLKLYEGSPHVVDFIRDKKIDLMINTPLGKESQYNDYELRRAAVEEGIPYTTTISEASSAIEGIEALKNSDLTVKCIQEYHAALC